MNVLTKVFVVLTTILSVVLVSLVVPFVANTEKYKDQRDAEAALRKAAQVDAQVAQLQVAASRTELNAQLDDVQKLLTAQRTLNDSLKGELATARGDLERTRADLVRTQADIANLTAASAQLTTIQKDMSTELNTRREENTKMAKTIIELEAANNDLASARATLERQRKLAAESLVKTQEELTEVRAELEKIPQEVRNQYRGQVVDSGGTSPEIAILAQVADVKQSADTTLVQLNVGAAGGIKERMKFLVHRDGQYLGTLIIMTVDDQAAVGRVTIMKAGATIKAGDAARAGPVS